MMQKIDDLAAAAQADLASVGDAEQLEAFRVRYLGTKGALKDLMGLMKDVPGPQKRDFGQKANALKQSLQAAFDEKKASLGAAAPVGRAGGPLLDLTEPGTEPRLGRAHIIRQTIDELLDVFGRMGFDVATGPELEDEHHNFVALNIPAEHPARDPLDNYYVAGLDSKVGLGDNPAMLRSQTSTVQIRVMEHTQPPLRIVSTGRVYRPDEHDATHYSMFHQIEGLYVDRNVSMVDLKTTLLNFAHAMFGPDADVKLVPSYFPFTEPSAELYLKMDFGKGPQWMEVGGCGMVDPAVFEAVGYDPEQWTGFAFGLGIERLAMRKYQIQDIRWLFENDARFLRQF
jgi:phenylalanyl-tRNA synthetase alpha chain